VPAAAVIPAPAVYTNIAAVKTLVVDRRVGDVVQPWLLASAVASGRSKWLRPLGEPGQLLLRSPDTEVVPPVDTLFGDCAGCLRTESIRWLSRRGVRGQYHEQNSASIAADLLGRMTKHGMLRDRPAS
jgi:hypothetical protein